MMFNLIYANNEWITKDLDFLNTSSGYYYKQNHHFSFIH